VGSAIAANVGEVYGVLHAAHIPRLDVVASLVRALEDAESFATVLEHLGHEGHGLQPSGGIESGEDFFLRTYFDKFSRQEIQLVVGIL
jgi:hypothetical protein